MGYSCTCAADNMLGLIRHTFSNGKYSNGMTIKGRSYFYEIGREHADGHITGTLLENVDRIMHVSLAISASALRARFFDSRRLPEIK